MLNLLINAATKSATKTVLLRRETALLQRNLTKRAERINKAGFSNEATANFAAVKATKPKNDEERREKLKELRKLDRRQGMSVKTAEKVQKREVSRAKREATANRRSELANTITANPRAIPNAADVKDLYDSTRRSVAAKARAVKKKYGGTQATDAFDEWEANRTANPTQRKKLAELRQLIKISKFQGINVAGADLQLNRGIAAFGQDYEYWTPEVRGAAWEGFQRLAAIENTSIGSELLLAEIRMAAENGQLHVAFYHVEEEDGKGGKKQVLQAAVARSLDTAQVAAHRAEFTARKLAEMRAKSNPARLY